MPMDQLCFPYDEIISFRQQKEITICIYYVSGILDVAHLLTQTSLRSLLLLETQNQKWVIQIEFVVMYCICLFDP